MLTNKVYVLRRLLPWILARGCRRIQLLRVLQNTFFDKYPMTLETNIPWLWRQISHGNGDKYPLKTTGFEDLHVFYCKCDATYASAPHFLKISSISYPYQCLFGMGREKIFVPQNAVMKFRLSPRNCRHQEWQENNYILYISDWEFKEANSKSENMPMEQ